MAVPYCLSYGSVLISVFIDIVRCLSVTWSLGGMACLVLHPKSPTMLHFKALCNSNEVGDQCMQDSLVSQIQCYFTALARKKEVACEWVN